MSSNDAFAPVARPPRTRWINPRRRVATWLIAAGIAVVFFGGGVGAGWGIAATSGYLHAERHEGILRGNALLPGREPWFGSGIRPGPRSGSGSGSGRGRLPSNPTAPTSPAPSPSPAPSTSP